MKAKAKKAKGLKLVLTNGAVIEVPLTKGASVTLSARAVGSGSARREAAKKR